MGDRKMLVLGAVGGFLLLLILPMLFSSCLKGCGGKNIPTNKNANTASTVYENKTLVVWALYDDQELYDGIFQQFTSAHSGFVIEYHKFTDVEEYKNLLINEIAEGKGPDIAMIHNTWLFKDKNKFSTFPIEKGMNVEKYKKTFVGVAGDDLILTDDQGIQQIYGFPSSVDSLALYYNKSYFRDYVLSSTMPSEIWNTGAGNDIVSQVVKINHPDLSFERFNPSGIALGRTDNIKNGFDIFNLLLLQYGAKLYDDDMRTSILPNSTGVNADTGEAVFPALNALQLFTSFASSEYKHYSWNDMITKKEKEEEDIGAFTSGKTAMIFGYSSTLDQIKNSIKYKREKGKKTIEDDSVGIAPVPQVSDKASEGRVAYASYYPFVVPRTSKYPSEAWDLVIALVDKPAQEVYWEKNHKPTSIPELIDKQSPDPTYGIFALQSSYARSIKMIDNDKFKEIFSKMIMDVVNGVSDPRKALTDANVKIQCLLDQYNNVPGKMGVDCLGGE